MSFNEQMKQKAEEVHLQEKAKDFGQALSEVMKAALGVAAGYAAENRPKVDAMLDKAEHTIAEKTGGKQASTVKVVRVQLDKGIDKLVEQQGTGSTGTGPSQPGAGQPQATQPGDSSVPDDSFKAFPDDDPRI